MREQFSLSVFFQALSAWEIHQASYVTSFTKLNQSLPSSESLRAYRSTWIEGFCNALADFSEPAAQPAETVPPQAS